VIRSAGAAGRRSLAGLTVLILAAGCTGGANATPAPVSTLGPTATPAATATATSGPTGTPTPAPAPQAGQMTTGRTHHTATALVDGRVLVAGGYPDNTPMASADLYDPDRRTFTATGSMATARGFHTATRLSDGRVLVTGGNPGAWDYAGTLIASAEVYDPTTGTFGPTGSMTTARDVHTATLLLDGRVLITGGEDRFRHPLATAELYDPGTGTFSPTGSMTAARDLHVATLLADGRVLVTGGTPFGVYNSDGQVLASAEVYDPKTGSFSPTGSMAAPRASHTATLLKDGRVLVTGGAKANMDGTGTTSLASAELWDPKTGTFTTTGSMTVARTFQEATLLADGRVLVTGGCADGWYWNDHFYGEAEIYDPKTGRFTSTGSMADGLVAQTATLLADGHVLIAGGFDGRAHVTTTELYDPKTDTFSPTSPGG
jgi:Galactose oxidase, central domain/Kelch motif